MLLCNTAEILLYEIIKSLIWPFLISLAIFGVTETDNTELCKYHSRYFARIELAFQPRRNVHTVSNLPKFTPEQGWQLSFILIKKDLYTIFLVPRRRRNWDLRIHLCSFVRPSVRFSRQPLYGSFWFFSWSFYGMNVRKWRFYFFEKNY